MNLDVLKTLNIRDPRVLMRVILGLLLLGNLTAFYFVLFPLGGSPEELDETLKTLQEKGGAQRKSIERLRVLTTKVEGARKQAGDFEVSNFTDRRVVYSTLVNEITQAADSAGIKLKDHALQNEEIEGSDTLGMITVNANYEGTYGDLLNFVNRIDRSERFVIIDSLAATPQQGTNQLNVTMKMNLFVRNTADLRLPNSMRKELPPAEKMPDKPVEKPVEKTKL
ncbi:MAG: type 4a pilus biogenesis protein PilO [Bryobacteraceae bacterium]|nr:type 4a pilus biogenesis protein PilO [Bryobacteraceae bacterium]